MSALSSSDHLIKPALNEAFLTQNPALGAAALWRAACGYQAVHKTRQSLPLPLAFTIVPMVFNEALFSVLSRTYRESGLRKFTEKFAETKDAKSDILLSLHDRCFRWRDISWASLRIAFATRLLILTSDAVLVPLSETPARGIPPKMATLLKNAEKLGAWYGELSIHEVATLLKIRF
ncbi:hypothetical protein SAMN02745166_01127 [Prosthecobacter debontii]|uniref:Uncharacterized protein n=1 Tax=Prosthecobacter debontii TaxID=48467 RepID=A0A1T4X767_9BACT|nr:three component ABC system middle component [Prosthecobacter debontii]SKA85279.1 hypothetical protein SAMN02745166_01127 [Prosthecobacter debontii]